MIETIQIRQQLAAIRSAVSAVENLLKRLDFDTDRVGEQTDAPPLRRDASHFRENGIHLSDAGVEAVRELFSNGRTIEQVAATIGISVSAASDRRRDWLRSLKAEQMGAEE
jgi:hypothetical protein